MHSITRYLVTVSLTTFFATLASAGNLPEIRVFGSADEVIAEYKKADYWGRIEKGTTISVPPYLTVATSPTWDKQAASLPLAVKKELFYRSLLPLVLYSNEVILEERERLVAFADRPGAGDREWLADIAVRYRMIDDGDALPDGEALATLVSELLERVDAVPPSLALGQAAYESGYGTSRFAREGNAFFGQWTYGGKGMQPKEKRASKGNYAVAAYEWPLDSVRGYMQNLNSHRAYKELRDKRAAARSEGRMPSGAELAETLRSYSEKGATYVETLKGVMSVNELALADSATLRKQQVVVIVDVPTVGEVDKKKAELESMRKSGELETVLSRMGVSLN